MKLVDTHAHVEELTDIEGSLARAKAKGLAAIVAVGSSSQANARVLKLAEDHHNFVYAAIGIHPHEAETESKEAIDFVESQVHKCVAIGEVGMDYKYNVDKSRQREVFDNLLQIARNYDKAVALHSRGSWEDVLSCVQNNDIRKAVFHWYSGPLETLRRILDNGYFISVTPAVGYSPRHREATEVAPIESILLETDAPVRYRGVPSEPSDVAKVLDEVARIKSVSINELAETTTRNACHLFGIPC